MTLPDHLIINYLEVYTEVPLEQIAEIAKQVTDVPMKRKLFLAHEIVRRCYGAEVAGPEQEWFLQTFSERKTPADIPEILVEPGEQSNFALVKRLFDSQKLLLNKVCNHIL